MMQIIIFLLLFLAHVGFGYCQEIEKIVPEKSASSGVSYLAVKPFSEEIKGVLVLLPGFGEKAENIFPETKLEDLSYTNEILLVSLEAGEKIYVDQEVLAQMQLVLEDVQKRFSVESAPFVFGGFSAGGTIALRYVQLCKENPSAFPVQPVGVFTVDSPVDLVALYQYFEREISKDFSAVGVNEAERIKGLMDRKLGSPHANLPAYVYNSPFYVGKESGNERFLKEVAVRVYHDIDINWSLKNRRRSFFDNNELEASELINRLLLLGNEQAEFKVGKTGYRSNGQRHPHSWSIVDEHELIMWMKNL